MKDYLRRGALIILAITQLMLFPAYSIKPAIAQEDTTTESSETTDVDVEPDTTETITPDPNQNQPQEPVEPPKAGPPPSGADSAVFVYNYTTNTWESFLYSYNPVSKVRTMKNVPTVRYNFQAGLWEKLGWSFHAPSQTYRPYVISTHSTQPSGVVMGPVPGVSGTSGSGTSINGTGPYSSTNVNNATNNNANLQYTNNADYAIMMDLLSRSGNASVLGNTSGGNALTGDADSSVNVLNQVQSQWNIDDILTFSSDLYGDIYGDLYVNTQNVGPYSDVAVNNERNNNLDIDVNNDTTIVNDINVVAESGDATVSGNTTGGDATSGDANALVNILNMINSSITSGANFMGTLNIHGDFNGDILFPKGALETLIASTGPESTVDVANATNNNLNMEVNNDTSIANNIQADASSGDASVIDNTTGGNATTGNASSQVTMLNLTGKNVVSENTLLVFINVLGEWVGVLMDAPVGTTAAAIGGGANVATNNSTNNTIDYTENNNAAITNNVNAKSRSGDATVSENTTGGNATSGDANTTVNVANLVGSDITSNSWFGVLFINVFGKWSGSFGVDTAAGESQAGINGAQRGGQGGDGPTTAPRSAVKPQDVKVYGFSKTANGGHRAVALAGSTGGGQGGDTLGAQTTSSTPSDLSSTVLGSSTVSDGSLEQTGDGSARFNIPVGVLLIAASAGLIFGNKLLVVIIGRARAKRL